MGMGARSSLSRIHHATRPARWHARELERARRTQRRAALLADVRAYYGDASVGLYLDDRQRDATLDPVASYGS